MSHFLRPLLARHPVAQALVNERTGSVVAETLETAFDSGTRRRGLLGRDDLAAGTALVLAPCNAVHTVRMRFPIDVVFVARDGRVTKIVRAARRLARGGVVRRVRDHRASRRCYRGRRISSSAIVSSWGRQASQSSLSS